MKKVTIQAYEDRSRTEGGHAVILLQGITEPKGLVAFRVRPLDAARGPDGNGGWIGGEHLPVSVANTEYGLEIVAGPDVTESELLLPGTVVEIQIPASSVRGEFLWPNIAPLMRPKRRNIAIVKPRPTPRPADAPRDTAPATEAPPTLAASEEELAAAARAEAPAAVQKDTPTPVADHFPYPLAAAEASAEAAAPQAVPPPAKPAAAAVTRPAEPIAFPFPATPATASAAPIKSAIPTAKPVEINETRPAPASVEAAKMTPAAASPRAESAPPAAAASARPEPAKSSPSVKSDHRGETTVDQTKSGPGRALTASEQELENEISDKYGWAFKKDLGVMLSKKFFALGASRHDDVQEEAIRATHHSDHHNIAAEATAILAHHEVDHTPVPVTDYTPAPGIVEKPYSGGYAGDYESAGSTPAYAPSRAAPFPFPDTAVNAAPNALPEKRAVMETGMAAALIGLVAAGIAGIAMLSNSAEKGADATASSTSPPSLTAAIASPLNAPSPDLIFQALQPPAATSPRGVAAAGVGADKALENANRQLLASGTQRDTEEGAFWLKHFITGTLGDNRTMRVLTQLGSIYAEPATGTPDYSKSRLVWEIAGAAGDPVAMCFLGLLHENGLGVAADKETALQWYERAKAKGGCPSVDEALARLRK